MPGLYVVSLVAMTAGIAAVIASVLGYRPGPHPLPAMAVWWVLALLAGTGDPRGACRAARFAAHRTAAHRTAAHRTAAPGDGA